MATYKYSRWDGSQRVFDLDEDSLLEALSDDILAHGDLESALRGLYQRGIRGEEREQRIEGLRDLIERLKIQRQKKLRRHNVDSLVEELKQRLQDVVDSERRGIKKRLREARQHLAEAGQTAQDLRGPMRVLEERARRSRDTLDSLPEGFAGAIKELNEYDFMDPEARQKFQELLDMLRQRMTENYAEELRHELAKIFQTRTQREWVQLFLDENVPGGPVHENADFVHDPHFQSRGNILEQDHPQAGRVMMASTPIKLPGETFEAGPAPSPGEHTDEVLASVLGYAAEAIAGLKERGVI